MQVRAVRVCHVMTADLWAGAEVQVATLASYLAARPEVTLTAVLFNDGWLASELRALGITVAVIDERQHSPFAIVRFLVRFFRRHEIELVHTHRYKDNILGSIAAALAGVPHVVRTIHGRAEPLCGWEWLKFQLYQSLDVAALWSCADRVVAVSKRMAEALEQSGSRPGTLTYVHNGVDLRKIRATGSVAQTRAAIGLPSGSIVIGTAGRLTPVKGQEYLVRAAARIVRQESQARFLFVGSGPLESRLRHVARQLGVEDACVFIDPARDRRASVYDLIAAMDVFVLPSLHEGIPMALLEALALERPVVASAVGGIPEIITHEATGLLVEPKNERELADACLDLARNRRRARAFAVRGRRTVEREFSHEANGEAVVALYQTVARASSAPRAIGAMRLCWALTRACLSAVLTRIERFAFRRRMEWIRRHPATLSAALGSAASVLVVCHGNIIRSAFAARLLAQALGKRRVPAIASAGLAAIPGRPSHPTAVSIATPRGVDLSDHRASAITPAAVAAADVIFVMDLPQLIAIRRRFPESRGKTFLLSCLAADGPLEVRDPVDGDEPVFQACFDHISRAVRPIVNVLAQAAQ